MHCSVTDGASAAVDQKFLDDCDLQQERAGSDLNERSPFPHITDHKERSD